MGGQNIPYVRSHTAAGLVFGYLARHYGRLGPGVWAHAITNGLSVFVVFSTR